jgi:hypothetical protein
MDIIGRKTIKKNDIICMMIIVFQGINGQEPPVEFEFNQSTLQAVYFFKEVTLNGAPIESDDWVAAFNGDICLGARQWDTSNCGGDLCDVPTMGDDGSDYAVGYMQNGDIPAFKIYDASTGNIYDAMPSGEVDGWSNNGFSMNDLLEAEGDILGCMEMAACNYGPDATVDDGSCEEFDCAGECGGAAEDLGCGCGEAEPSGCDDICSSTLEFDICGECGGNEFDASNCLSIYTHSVNNFSINSIYPNPFNPIVSIDLSIDIAGHLQLYIFTIEGAQIKTIYNGPSIAGESTFTWTPKNRASGFYFINAILDGRVETQKVLLLK